MLAERSPLTSDAALAAVDTALPSEAAAAVKALRLRASYGGMQGDQAMLRRYADLWHARWRPAIIPLPSPPTPCPGHLTRQWRL